MLDLDSSLTQILRRVESELKPAFLQTLDTINAYQRSTLYNVKVRIMKYYQGWIFFQGLKKTNNKLIFHGVPPEPLELEVIDDPDITRDILETMIKCIFRDMLKIKRIVPLTQVYRHSSLEAEKIKPIVVGFLHIKDKESISTAMCVEQNTQTKRDLRH